MRRRNWPSKARIGTISRDDRSERKARDGRTDGEDLIGDLLRLSVDSAFVVCGIGMLREIELGYWNGEVYEKHRLDPPVELVSLQGSLRGPATVASSTCSLCWKTGRLGGHLFAGTVHNTAEIALRFPEEIALERRQEESGLTGLYPRLRPADENAG